VLQQRGRRDAALAELQVELDLQPGDVTYRAANGNMALLRVARIDERHSVAPVLVAFDFTETYMPAQATPRPDPGGHCL
jgi:hypothetical protein